MFSMPLFLVIHILLFSIYYSETCTGRAADTCSSCSADNKRETAGNECACMTGYFDDGSEALCKACHYSW